MHPRVEDRVHVVRTSRQRLPFEVRARVEQLVRQIGVSAVVIEQRHEHVATVATDDDVLDARIPRQAVERQMALHEATVLLRLEAGDDLLDRHRKEPRVDPRR